MSYYVINHKVKDFNSWKKEYDKFEPTRKRFGVKEQYALQSSEDTNHVMVVGEGTKDAVNKFLKSNDLKNAMKGAGIKGKPVIFIGENKR